MSLENPLLAWLAAATFLTALIYAWRYRLFQISNVHHVHRIYYQMMLILTFTFALLFLFDLSVFSFVVGFSSGILLAWISHRFMMRRYSLHLDGPTLWNDTHEPQRVALSFICSVFGIFAGFTLDFVGDYFSELWLALLVAWLITTITSLQFIRERESDLGQPIIEQERDIQSIQ